MFCKYCGKAIDEDAKFCSGCGKSTVEVSTSSANQAEHDTPEADKKKPIFKRWWFWVVVIAILFTTCSRPTTPTVTHPNVSELTYKLMCEEIEFSQLARNPDSYKDQMMRFTGEVIQVVEGSGAVDIRMNVTLVNEDSNWSYYDDTIYATVRIEDSADRILEGDIVTIYGVCCGAYSYKSILGTKVTLPKIEAMYYEIAE